MLDYEFAMRGVTPILMHRDDVLAADELIGWRKDPRNKGMSVPGDDRSPPWTWQAYLYSDGERLAVPQECLMTALRHAGTKIIHKGQTTFKAMTQSGLLIASDYCPFTNRGAEVAMGPILALRELPFGEQLAGVRKLGFDLSVKRASVDKKKHVRVRARFDEWEVRGVVAVSEPAITASVLAQLFEIAGRLSGLMDWRPSSPKSPGPYGMFHAEVKPYKAGRKVA